MNIPQDFFKTQVAVRWDTTGAGNFYISDLPTPTVGYLVINPNSTTKREIVKYSAVGTDINGNYITISASGDRGLGGTTAQTHEIGEAVRMNITSQYWEELQDAIDDIVAGGAEDASTVTKGLSKLSVAPVDADEPIAVGDNDPRVPTADPDTLYLGIDDLINTSSGAGDAGKGIKTDSNGLIDTSFTFRSPTMKVFINKTFGSSTTRFDITNPSGTTFRYTYDSTGTDPEISSSTVPIGTVLTINAQNFNAANNGTFTVTGVGSNYFEVTNASGVAEDDKTIGTGSIVGSGTWTKPTGLKYAIVEVCGGGGGGGGTTSSGSGGGGGGGYANKLIQEVTLSLTETVTVGAGGTAGAITGGNGGTGGTTSFGSHLSATGGSGGGQTGSGGDGGIGSNGNKNIEGSDGSAGEGFGGSGGNSYLGGGGKGSDAPANGSNGNVYGGGGGGAVSSGSGRSGGTGANGICIVTEYYN